MLACLLACMHGDCIPPSMRGNKRCHEVDQSAISWWVRVHFVALPSVGPSVRAECIYRRRRSSIHAPVSSGGSAAGKKRNAEEAGVAVWVGGVVVDGDDDDQLLLLQPLKLLQPEGRKRRGPSAKKKKKKTDRSLNWSQPRAKKLFRFPAAAAAAVRFHQSGGRGRWTSNDYYISPEERTENP